MQALLPKRLHVCKKCSEDIIFGPTCVAQVCGGRVCRDCGYPASNPVYMKLSKLWGEVGPKTLPICHTCNVQMTSEKREGGWAELSKTHIVFVENQLGPYHTPNRVECAGGCGTALQMPVLRLKERDGHHMNTVCLSCASRKNKCQFCQKAVERETDPQPEHVRQAQQQMAAEEARRGNTEAVTANGGAAMAAGEEGMWSQMTRAVGQAFESTGDLERHREPLGNLERPAAPHQQSMVNLQTLQQQQLQQQTPMQASPFQSMQQSPLMGGVSSMPSVATMPLQHFGGTGLTPPQVSQPLQPQVMTLGSVPIVPAQGQPALVSAPQAQGSGMVTVPGGGLAHSPGTSVYASAAGGMPGLYYGM
uniref:Uncharacterized protein n=1 Tax=Chromera velia CCMP2878 TaxID=1169474 RepID=A0A0G4G418_9ALVE|eukprot:Cvel_4138.t1-p1 / transcript=Cvel_4138.t1 / gene=Cvel_4138 / organism=Chromera_velia_CCMP2878 / gene_product=hypothetical protein / transcript_product=hypothetical protein / location=Cvel_scaffold177:58503-61982(+) / protein_length=361 / sequence_SO=supercontig / SO=protein_coding / is_pseudo=false